MFNLSNIIYLVIAVVLSMSIHETAHGLVSYWMGDPTAKMEGRLSLNPFKNGWYDTDNAVFKESWMQFARSLAQGHVVVSDLYSNTQVMTGDVLSGLGSSAAILYPTTEAPAPILATETHHCLTACRAVHTHPLRNTAL